MDSLKEKRSAPDVLVANEGTVFLFNPLIAFVLLLPMSRNGIGLKETVYVFFYSTQAGLIEPEQALMVGDTPADAGAVAAGCRVLLVPPAPPGMVNGIGAVLALTVAIR